MTLLRIASDWHLAPRSPPLHGQLASEFLRRARAEGAGVILNGDVFEDLFHGRGRSERAHPGVVAEMEALLALGRLRRTRGNHDPDVGEERIVLDWPGLGRVLVTHGHTVDPINRSWLGQLGDGLSARFGRFSLVRGAAALAESTAYALLGRRIEAGFRARCLALVESAGCRLGVFGHVHEAHLAEEDGYANAGALTEDRLEYLEFSPGGPRLRSLTSRDLAAPGRARE